MTSLPFCVSGLSHTFGVSSFLHLSKGVVRSSYTERLVDAIQREFACAMLCRSLVAFLALDILNIQATEALKNGKIREFIAFDLQYGYQMWIWFVNFLDQKKVKLILKTEHQFNTSV